MTDPTALLGLDVAALAEFLAASPEAPDVTPPLSAAVVPGGLSHLTYELRDAAGGAWLLRRPAPVAPRSGEPAEAGEAGVAEDLDDDGLVYEHRLVAALQGRIPVARARLHCADVSVIGAPFLLSDKPPGELLHGRERFAALTEQQARARAEAIADVLADLHTLDPAISGLEDHDGADAYLYRQLDAWDRRYAMCQSREIRGLFELAEGLRAAVPVTQRTVLLHGGPRLAVVCFDDSGLTAVLDWGQAALGDPLVDLGLLLARWDDPVRGDKLLHTGFPSGRALADRYAAATGLIIDDLDWYIALSHYKLAVMAESAYHRYTRGLAVGEPEPFVQAGAAVPGLVELGRVHLDKTR